MPYTVEDYRNELERNVLKSLIRVIYVIGMIFRLKPGFGFQSASGKSWQSHKSSGDKKLMR